MRIVIEARDLPGADFVSDGEPLHNVHVAVQVGKEPVDLVRGDADDAWDVEVRAVVEDGSVDLRARRSTARRASGSSTSRGATFDPTARSSRSAEPS